MAVNKVRRNGSYAPLSAHYYKDDAVGEAGEAAELLFVRGLAFCADVLSDGFISDMQLARFVGVGMKDPVRRAKRLVEVGLWGRAEGGYQVLAWLGWNRSRAEIMDYQAKDAARKGKGTTGQPESEPPPPDPPNGVPPESERNPNGSHAESEPVANGSPNGFQPRARTPLHSTPATTTSSSDAAVAGADPKAVREDVEELCEHLRARVVGNGSKATVSKGWRDAARRMLDIDGRDAAEAHRLIDWCQDDSFWCSNVLGMSKFRAQYDALRLKAGFGQVVPAGDTREPVEILRALWHKADAQAVMRILGMRNAWIDDEPPPSSQIPLERWVTDKRREWINAHFEAALSALTTLRTSA